MIDSNIEIEIIFGSCLVKYIDLMNEVIKFVIIGVIIMVWTLIRLGIRSGEEKYYLFVDIDGVRFDRGKLIFFFKDCFKVVFLVLIYRCLDVLYRLVRFIYVICGYILIIIILYVYIC